MRFWLVLCFAVVSTMGVSWLWRCCWHNGFQMLGAFVVGIIAGLVVGVVDRSVDYGGRVFDFVFCGMFVGCLWLAFDNHVVCRCLCGSCDTIVIRCYTFLMFLSRRTRRGE